MELKGSRTAANLMLAFAGESQARNRYTFAASVSRKEGFEHIAAIFEETAANEKEHAKLFWKHLAELGAAAVQIEGAYPVATGDSAALLASAVQGETEEFAELYPEFARVAREEGFQAIAHTFDMVAKVEREHAARFRRLHDHVVRGTVFERDGKIYWRCRNCGHIHEATKAPAECPVCHHPRAFFEPVAEAF